MHVSPPLKTGITVDLAAAWLGFEVIWQMSFAAGDGFLPAFSFYLSLNGNRFVNEMQATLTAYLTSLEAKIVAMGKDIPIIGLILKGVAWLVAKLFKALIDFAFWAFVLHRFSISVPDLTAIATGGPWPSFSAKFQLLGMMFEPEIDLGKLVGGFKDLLLAGLAKLMGGEEPRDMPGWTNGGSDNKDCSSYVAHGFCKDGAAVTGKEWTLGAKWNFPENNCVSCGFAGAPPDTPDWKNGGKYDCSSYVANGWCKDGAAVTGQEWTLGAQFNFPEENCVACGFAGRRRLSEAGSASGGFFGRLMDAVYAWFNTVASSIQIKQNTCRTLTNGVESFNSCASPTCGCNTCSHAYFGCKTSKTCKTWGCGCATCHHADFGCATAEHYCFPNSYVNFDLCCSRHKKMKDYAMWGDMVRPSPLHCCPRWCSTLLTCRLCLLPSCSSCSLPRARAAALATHVSTQTAAARRTTFGKTPAGLSASFPAPGAAAKAAAARCAVSNSTTWRRTLCVE